MTTFMEGTPFEVKSMKPVDQAAHAQTVATPGRDDNRRVTRVMITGDSIVQAQPDTAILTIAVVTQNRSAHQRPTGERQRRPTQSCAL